MVARVAGLLGGRFACADNELMELCGPVAWVVGSGIDHRLQRLT